MSRCEKCLVPLEVRRNTWCCSRCTKENPQSEVTVPLKLLGGLRMRCKRCGGEITEVKLNSNDPIGYEVCFKCDVLR